MLIDIDFRDKRPLYEQVSDRLEELMLAGVIAQNEALPSVRALAVELSINPNTVQKAYGVLEQKGLIYSVSGRGSFAGGLEQLLPKKQEELLLEQDSLANRAEAIGLSRERLIERIRECRGKTGKEIGKGEES
ncbi:MAG: GntR family transcriptional regulator [Lachnospiraceae bacterium]|nr:GntR family transcriptional regulator [Lachnospiraceae bacterium]